ncbi:heme-degrading domain-containing protein [Chthonobacter albigriseus]|uniref:heme-degrading domain-containing protein n=1 Tax=Chthonobacter albigriseus TaxID=1683161 RepID=UPI00188827DC|nr:heme-degrading domain-containing protein [Chthonobacter albigriseus]
MANDDLLAELLDQERRLTFPRFDNDTAIDLGLAVVAEARAKALPVTVDVTRAGQQIFHMALPGTVADNDHWVARKVALVMRFGHSSFYMGRKAAAKGVPFHETYLVDPTAFAPHGGCFPIIVEGTGLVGTVTVSGLPQEEDHKLVVEVLERFLKERFDR